MHLAYISLCDKFQTANITSDMFETEVEKTKKARAQSFRGSAKTKKEIKGKDDEIAKLKAEIKRLNRKAYPGRYRLSSRAILTSLRVNRNTDSEAFDTEVDDIVFNQYMPQMDRHTLGEGERSASQPPRYSL